MKKNFSIFIIGSLLLVTIVLGFSINTNNDEPVRKNLRAKKVADKNRGYITAQSDEQNPNPISPQSALFESFEGGTFPPPGWSKINNDGGGTGWTSQTNGTTPVPGFVGGVITVPPGGGNKCANVSYVDGGPTSNDQYLITPQLTNVQSNDSLSFYLRYWPNSYRDSIEVLISTTTPTIAAFTTLVFRKNFAVTVGDTNWVQYKFRIGNLVTAGSNIYIAFREVVANNFADGASFSLDLVSTTGVSGFANDIATISNNAPVGSVLVNSAIVAPKATFFNAGTANQTNVPVTYKITGPSNYTSNKVITSINSSASANVTFDSTFNPTLAGTYNVTIYCSLPTDQNRANDTLKTSFTVINPNYGSGGTYFFANSTSSAASAPSQPNYCRLDTAGSTSLVVNSVLSRPLKQGTLDDGQWGVALGSGKIKFMGVSYDSVYIGTNGLICFFNFIPGGGNWNPPSAGLPGQGSGGTTSPGVYPLWMDQDWGSIDQPVNRLSYKIDGAKNRLIVTYDRSPIYGGLADEFFTYQAIFEIKPDTSGVNSRIEYAYDNSSTTINVPLLVGLQNAGATNFLQYSFINSAAVVITPGPILDGDISGGLAVQFGPNAANLTGNCKDLTMTFRLEAIQLTRKDTISVELRSGTSPYALIETSTGVYDSTNGTVTLSYGIAQNGVNYYLRAMHRNSVPTWSATTITLSSSYNFTTNINKAFGSNQAQVGPNASFFTGDVTGDFCVDVGDVVPIYNDASNFVGGPYLLTDLNYDEFVDVTDVTYCYNNVSNFVCEANP